MNTYLIRVELLHDEFSSDYTKLHNVLHALDIFRVVYNPVKNIWYDLPPVQYILADTAISTAKCLVTVEKAVEKLLRDHKKYTEAQISKHYSMLVCKIALDSKGNLELVGDLKPTTD